MSFHRILIALDSDVSSARAVTYGASLAKELGAGIELLHVWQPPAYAYGTARAHQGGGPRGGRRRGSGARA